MTGVRLPARVEILHIFTASRPALRPTQPTGQWIPGAVSAGVKITICR